MKSIGYIIAAIVVVGFIIFLLTRSNGEAKAYKEAHKNYVAANGKVTAVRQTSPGIKRTISKVYTVAFTTADGQQVTESNAAIGRVKSYEVGDTLQLFYDPANPQAGATDRDGLEMNSHLFSSQNLLVYGIGIMVVAFVVFLNMKRR